MPNLYNDKYDPYERKWNNRAYEWYQNADGNILAEFVDKEVPPGYSKTTQRDLRDQGVSVKDLLHKYIYSMKERDGWEPYHVRKERADQRHREDVAQKQRIQEYRNKYESERREKERQEAPIKAIPAHAKKLGWNWIYLRRKPVGGEEPHHFHPDYREWRRKQPTEVLHSIEVHPTGTPIPTGRERISIAKAKSMTSMADKNFDYEVGRQLQAKQPMFHLQLQKKKEAAERKRERRERREAAARTAAGDTVVMSQAQLDRMVPR